jgi:hypothetical protein
MCTIIFVSHIVFFGSFSRWNRNHPFEFPVVFTKDDMKVSAYRATSCHELSQLLFLYRMWHEYVRLRCIRRHPMTSNDEWCVYYSSQL